MIPDDDIRRVFLAAGFTVKPGQTDLKPYVYDAAHKLLELAVAAADAREQRLVDWMVEHGLLHYHESCRRPDGSHGPAWVVRTPYMANGDSCEAWHAYSAEGALRAFLNPQPPATGKEPR